MPRSPTVPVTTTSGEPSDGTYSTVRPHGRAQALRHEGRLRRDHGDRCQTPARTSTHCWRSAQRRDQREAGPLDQVPAHHRQTGTTYFFTEISLAAMILSIACLATESNHKILILAN